MKKPKTPKPWYEFKAEAQEGVAELRIFGPIGGGFWLDEDTITGKEIAKTLDALGEDTKTIRVLVNSPGGSVFDGIHIANALRRQREEHGRNVAIEIEALAASAATLITSAGSTVKMPRNALMMIHDPIGFAEGPRETMIKVAQALERAGRAIVATYKWISKLNSKKLSALMAETTWMDADEALAYGLITEITDPVQVQAQAFEGAALDGVTIPEKYRERVRALFKGCGCTGPYAGADFAALANQAIDQRLEDEDELERGDVIDELVAATGETAETIEEILAGDLECPAEEIVAGFVEVLPITQEQADAALEADGCTEDEDETEDAAEEGDDEDEDEDEDGTAAGEGAKNSIKAQKGAGGKMKPKNTNGEAIQAAAAEKARNVGINDAAEVAIKAGLEPGKIRAQAKEAIAGDVTVEDFRAAMFEELAARSDASGPGPVSGGVEAGEAERDKRRNGIQAALWHRAGVMDTIQAAAKKKPDHPAFKDLDFDGREFRGLSILDHARETLERDRPGLIRGKGKMELAGAFLNSVGSGGMQSTSDFAVALENALNKTLLASFATAPEQWRLFCKVGTVTDFRAHNRYSLGYLSRLQEVKEGGEIKNKTIPDASKEVQQALTYANILALTRQAIINDDMGVFNDLAVNLGLAAGLSIELGVFDLLKLNSGMGPTMSDSVVLFNAAHGNVNATGSAISVAGIDADRVVMAAQTDVSGNVTLDLRPAVLVVPAGLGGAARVINESQYDHDGTKLQKPNMVRGIFRDIADSGQLTGTRRYMFADPALAPVIEVAFLEGAQEPYMEMEEGWRIDGVEWKVRHDFGIAAINYRGCVTNAGA